MHHTEPVAVIGLISKERLALRGIQLQVLKANTFEGLHQTELDLTDSTFERIDDFAFKGLIMTAVYLNHCVIRRFLCFVTENNKCTGL